MIQIMISIIRLWSTIAQIFLEKNKLKVIIKTILSIVS